MTRLSRVLFVAMSASFALCILGLLLGLLFTIYESFIKHRILETTLSASIPYYKCLGALGILGFLLFLAFLLTSISAPSRRK